MKSKTKTEAAKLIVKFIVGKSVSAVIVTIIHQNTETFKTSEKVQLYIGAYAIGSMVSQQSGNWTDEKIDMIVDAFAKIKEATKTA